MRQVNYKKLILPNLPYVFIALLATKLGEAARLAPGTDFSGKTLHIMEGLGAAFQSAAPSFHPIDLALARQFLLEQFVSRGMVVDFAVHQPDREDGGIPNPHFHVLCPIRPIEPDGTWGLKQRRVYELDEDGNRIRGADGNFVFNAVPTTDWGSPETLEHWRQTWAELCNAKFAEKGLDVRIDHRSYERQGVDLLPTVHEGATVRAMEKKGIRTEKGEFNRWIKATTATTTPEPRARA